MLEIGNMMIPIHYRRSEKIPSSFKLEFSDLVIYKEQSCLEIVNEIILCDPLEKNLLSTENTWTTEKITYENFHYISYESSSNINDLNKFRTEHLNTEELQGLKKLIKIHDNIFYKEGNDLSFTNSIKHEIVTKNENPIFVKTYRYPFIHQTEVRKQISDMLDKKIIRPSKSPYSAPAWVVPKKVDASNEQKWRIVIDY